MRRYYLGFASRIFSIVPYSSISSIAVQAEHNARVSELATSALRHLTPALCIDVTNLAARELKGERNVLVAGRWLDSLINRFLVRLFGAHDACHVLVHVGPAGFFAFVKVCGVQCRSQERRSWRPPRNWASWESFFLLVFCALDLAQFLAARQGHTATLCSRG